MSEIRIAVLDLLIAEDYKALLDATAALERLAYKDSVPEGVQILLKTFLDDVWAFIRKPNER